MNLSAIFHKLLHLPITRIILGIIILVLIYSGSIYVLGLLFNSLAVSPELNELIVSGTASIIVLFSYILLYRYYESRTITELTTHHLFRNLIAGIILGSLLQSLTILVMYIGGYYHIEKTNNLVYLIPSLTMGVAAAIFEELIMRGILFRITEERLGSYIALFISAIVFGLMHFGNPNSSLLISIALAIEAGLLLGIAYMVTRSLWLPIGIHFAWNFTQSGLYGAAVSGYVPLNSFVTAHIEGPSIITGGEFGPEASIQALIFCLIASVLLLILCYKKNEVKIPYWKR
jgi:membrane protease YdiL (CAAX protease family)